MTERIIKAYRLLYSKGEVKNHTDFCHKINFARQSWSDVINERREFPDKKINDLINVFKISPDYIFFGRYPIITPKFTRKRKQLINN